MTADVADRLAVGFLHVGRERSGVRRYGRLLAAEAATRPDLKVVESDVGDRDASLDDLRAAAARLAGTDVVHLQWKLADWGERSGGLLRLRAFRSAVGVPIVVTLHDVFPRRGVRDRWLSPGALGLRRLGSVAARVVVHSEEEQGRLAGLVPPRAVTVVPHFVEQRPALPDRDVARRTLGLTDVRVVTLLGAITKRRGHRLVIDALAELPGDVVAIFVGAPIEGRDHVGQAVRDHAATAGVADRVRFCGYVDEDELERILAATDVGLCPFRDMSASGALATWISVARPLVTSDLPALRELDALAPGALRRFAPYEPGALAATLRAVIEGGPGSEDPTVRHLADVLAMPRALDRYVTLYRAAARGA